LIEREIPKLVAWLNQQFAPSPLSKKWTVLIRAPIPTRLPLRVPFFGGEGSETRLARQID
jgi:hypothetical protein